MVVMAGMRKTILFLVPGLLLFSSCWNLNKTPDLPPPPPPKKVWGYKPVFSTDTSWLEIKATGPQPVKQPGKIYAKDHLIYQNELGSGIHVFDRSDPKNLVPVGFIKILGNSEISIKGNLLYANSFTDLVVVDLSNWQNVKQVKRLKHVFAQGASAGEFPGHQFIPLPEHGVYYDCPWSRMDPYTQILTGWERDSVYDNNCYYP